MALEDALTVDNKILAPNAELVKDRPECPSVCPGSDFTICEHPGVRYSVPIPCFTGTSVVTCQGEVIVSS